MKRFEVGNSYSVRSICDYDCIYSFEVVKRTNKTVWLRDSSGQIKSRRVRLDHYDNAECCDPHGRYSMSPVLVAK